MTRLTAIAVWTLVTLVLAGTVAALTFDREHRVLDATVRAAAPGRFVRLRDGITHYDISGPDSGRTVVLLSGATVPYYLWDPTRDALVANGFRTVRYDYFGRSYSDRPKLAYDLATYDGQLAELLDSLGPRGRVDVAGLSMGGVVATNFADKHADRVRSLTLVDPYFGRAGGTPLPLRLRGVGDLILTLAASSMAKGQLGDFLHPDRYPDWVARYEVQMQYEGFRRALLATMRGDVLTRSASSFPVLAKGTVPILLLWGTCGWRASSFVRRLWLCGRHSR